MPQLKRLYKAATPTDTVHYIRNILKGLDISIYEKIWRNIGGKIYSCQTTMENLEDLTTCGKGKDERYALAGAYAEMMERLQNLMIFSSRIGLRNREIFSVFNDTEEYENTEQLLSDNPEKCRDGIANLCAELIIPEDKSFLSGLFYDVKNDCQVRLPYTYMIAAAGSNGMCAGNEPAEALVQGLCEVMEREALKAIYSESVVPPNIPEDYFKGTKSYEIIKMLKDRNISVCVKDCSLGKGYPVVGVLLVNKNTGKYRFRLGCHTIFNYALERSITEAYQGFNNEILEKVGEDVKLGKDPFQPDENHQLFRRDRNFIKSINYLGQLRTGSRKAPNTIFSGAPTYPYTGWDELYRSSSYAEDLRILQNRLFDNGLEIYIRNVAFLDFPAYFIYITKLSPIFICWPWKTRNRMENILEYEKNRKVDTELSEIYSRLDSTSQEELLDLIEYIRANAVSPISDVRERQLWLDSIFHYSVPIKHAVLQEYLLSLLYYTIGDYEKAFEQMDITLKKEKINREEHKYYYIFRDALYFLSIGMSFKNLAEKLSVYYDQDTVAGVLEDMQKKDKIFNKVPVPNFNDYENSAKLQEIFAKIKTKAEQANLDQLQIRKFFQSSSCLQHTAS